MHSSVQQQGRGVVGYPLHHSERQAWRVHHCALLSGDWSGKSLRPDPTSAGATQPANGGSSGGASSTPMIETVWASTKLVFDPHTGKIKGEGVSLWQDQSFPFEVLGAFTPNFSAIEMLKRHQGAGVTHMAFSVDLQTQIMTGHFANGGTCTLHKISSNNSASANNNGGLGFPLHMQRSLSNTSGGSSVGPALDAPKDLLTFLSYCFADSPGIAAKIHATLQDNEIHEPESLTTLSHEEWKELGVVLGHRSKIKLQLQRFFPHLMKMNPDEPSSGGVGVGGATSPTNIAGVEATAAAAAASAQLNPPFHTHPAMQQQGYAMSAQPSHYVSASHYGQPQQPQQQQQSQSFGPPAVQIPLEYLCPITREIMDDPAVASDGHSYERASISHWLELKKTSPITGKILASKTLAPNLQLRKDIAQWRQTYGR